MRAAVSLIVVVTVCVFVFADLRAPISSDPFDPATLNAHSHTHTHQ